MRENLQQVVGFLAFGWDVICFDGPQYGNSNGKVTKWFKHQCGVAALKSMQAQARVKKFVALGQGQGGNELLAALTEPGLQLPYPISGVILDGTYFSYRSVAAERADMFKCVGKLVKIFPILRKPLAWWWVSDTYSAKDSLPRIKVPVLMMHGDADQRVPYSEGRKLWAVAPASTYFLTIRGGKHMSSLTQKPPIARDVAAEFIFYCIKGENQKGRFFLPIGRFLKGKLKFEAKKIAAKVSFEDRKEKNDIHKK